MRDFFKDWNPSLRQVLDLSTSCDRWRLAETPNYPTWHSPLGRLALLGDSVHGMFPDAAQVRYDTCSLKFYLTPHRASPRSSKTLASWTCFFWTQESRVYQRPCRLGKTCASPESSTSNNLLVQIIIAMPTVPQTSPSRAMVLRLLMRKLSWRTKKPLSIHLLLPNGCMTMMALPR